MCRLFVHADPTLWQTSTRRFCVDGAFLTMDFENFYWDVLDRIAARDHMSTERLVNTLFHEAIDADHTEGSFQSFLRVCCGRFLDLLQKGEIPDDETPIRTLDADAILKRERENAPHLRVVHDRTEKELG